MKDASTTIVTCWVGMPFPMRGNAQSLVRLLDDIRDVYEFNIDSVKTGEPCIYRMTTEGLYLLSQAFEQDCVASFGYSGLLNGIRDAVSFGVRLDSPLLEHAASYIGLRIPPGPTQSLLSIAQKVSSFLNIISSYLQPLNALVSYQNGLLGDDPLFGRQTSYERAHNLTTISPWPAMLNCVRGAFWGNVLGPQHCEILGGQARVLREAPVWQASALGSGAWLQLSETFPPPDNAITLLENYLAPLLNWTSQDEYRWRLVRMQATAEFNRSIYVSPATKDQISLDNTHHIRFTDSHIDGDNAVNIHIRRIPSGEEYRTIRGRILGWYLSENSDGTRLSRISFPILNGSVMRFSFDSTDNSGRSALVRLPEWLVNISDNEIDEIVIGTEVVG